MITCVLQLFWSQIKIEKPFATNQTYRLRSSVHRLVIRQIKTVPQLFVILFYHFVIVDSYIMFDPLGRSCQFCTILFIILCLVCAIGIVYAACPTQNYGDSLHLHLSCTTSIILKCKIINDKKLKHLLFSKYLNQGNPVEHFKFTKSL